MSRSKSHKSINVEVCGDCGATDAAWASLNKGILLCTQCCSIHRTLGRHISQVKHLQKSLWHPNQLLLLHSLNNNGANNIWEHTLLESGPKSLKKKPTAKDSSQIKMDYIKAKHLQCAFAFRQNYEDDLTSVINELGKQLHASVRTPNLETSFRLLVLGADPNYFHDEKCSTPLHVAVKSDQKLQVELLLTYGADPSCPDSQGKSPLDYAKINMNKELTIRLMDYQYEVTDMFSYYLSHRKPDHQADVHFIIPQNGYETNDTPVTKLHKLPNHLFVELVMDVYDEIDRRECEAIWLSCVDTIDLNVVPFLPVDSTLSTIRNQGRQKLARFSSPELKALVYDLLMDIQRRQNSVPTEQCSISEITDGSHIIMDDDPLYDSVASDEEFAAKSTTETFILSPHSDKESLKTSESLPIVDHMPIAPAEEVIEELAKQLYVSDNTITSLREEISKLRSYVDNLTIQNSELKGKLHNRHDDQPSRNMQIGGGECNNDKCALSLTSSCTNDFMRANACDNEVQNTGQMLNGVGLSDENCDRTTTSQYCLPMSDIKVQRPSSMYEPREALKNLNIRKHQTTRQYEESVIQCTTKLTRSIQKLCNVIQENRGETVLTAEVVVLWVTRLQELLTRDVDMYQSAIVPILKVVPHFQSACACFQAVTTDSPDADKNLEDYIKSIRLDAFQIAKYTKTIVTKYSSRLTHNTLST